MEPLRCLQLYGIELAQSIFRVSQHVFAINTVDIDSAAKDQCGGTSSETSLEDRGGASVRRESMMSLQPFEQHSSRILTQIYEGMTVYDRAGDKIGTVEHVYLGAVNEETDKHGGGPETASSPGRSESSLIEDFARAIFPADQVPELLRQRLLRHGFIRINSTGLFAADRYVMPDQIADVSEDRVTLRVTRDELIKR